MTATRLDRRSLAEQTYDWLKERIFTGRYAPGERLSIDEIARSLGVSRTPVRDALHRLAFEGLAIVSARRGTAVAQLSIDVLRSVYQARRILEPAIAAAAAAAARADDIATLRRIQEQWEELHPQAIYRRFAAHSRYSELDVRFHQAVAGTLRNERIDRLVGQLAVQRQVAPLLFGTGYQGPAKRIAEHRAVLEAIARRDAAGASEAMRAHIENSERDLFGFLEQDARRAASGRSVRHDGRAVPTPRGRSNGARSATSATGAAVIARSRPDRPARPPVSRRRR